MNTRMKIKTLSAISIALISLFVASSYADDKVTIDDFAFLAGYWQGEGFGGQSEEMWMPPSNGRMFGIFKQINDGELVFTEYLEISKQEDGWALRLKHFNPDFSGWEEKTDYVNFRFDSVSDNKAVFGGLSYEVTDGNKLVVSLRMRQDDGSTTTEYFHFTRSEI